MSSSGAEEDDSDDDEQDEDELDEPSDSNDATPEQQKNGILLDARLKSKDTNQIRTKVAHSIPAASETDRGSELPRPSHLTPNVPS